ncbi:MAG: FecR domain-containing protein [Opitutaceae bacterium]
MNSRPQPDSNADEQAALWAARLEGSSLSAADRTALDVWLAADPTHRPLLSGYCQFSATLEVQLPALLRAGAIAMPAMAEPARPRSAWSFAKLAGVTGAIAAATVLGFWFARPHRGPEDFSAPPGQRQTITLGDGTHVELNAQTNLQFVTRDGERRARLLEGEAFFVVTKNKAQPFTVETPRGSVRVTGTTFDVRTDAATFEVTVVEGSVRVSPGVAGAAKSSAVELGANDRLSVRNGEVSTHKLSRDALEDLLAWRQGAVVFDDERLDAALARFARYSGRSIQVSAAAGELLVGGRYGLDDLDGFLLQNEQLWGIRTTKEPGGALRVGLNSE